MLICWTGLILLTGPIPTVVCVVLPVLIIRQMAVCQGGDAISVQSHVSLFRRPRAVSEALKNLDNWTGPGRPIRRPLGTSGQTKWLDFEDGIFTERHFRLYGSAIGFTYALVLAFRFWQGVSVIGPTGKFACIDFCWIWDSGIFAVSIDPSRVYDFAAYSAAQNTLVGPNAGGPFFHFIYPPTMLFFTYPLGFMPYLVAFAVWIVATLLLYQAAIYAIIPRPAALIAAVLPIGVSANALLGQNGFLTAALIGLSLVFLERRPLLSGILIGLLTYKPHLGVLFPLALVASRNWRTLCSATASTVALSVAAAAAFGYQGWPSFIASLFGRNSSLSPDSDVELNLQSIYGLLHWAGANAWVSWTVHLTVAALVAAMVCALWAKPIPYFLKAAILCIGSVTVSPYLLGYDLCILSIAVAFLVRDGMSRGFLPGERIGMIICFVGLFPLATPVAPMIGAVLFFLAARRIAAWRRDSFTASRDDPIGRGVSGAGSWNNRYPYLGGKIVCSALGRNSMLNSKFTLEVPYCYS